MQKNWRKCVNIVIAGGDSSAKSREQNTSHRKRLRSLRGRSRKRMNDQTGAAPPASIEWRSTDFGNNSGASAFRHFNHFFLFYEFIKFSWKTLSELLFCFHSYRIRIPHSGAKEKKRKRTETISEKKLRIGRYVHTLAKKLQKNIVPEEMKKC